MYFDFSPEQYMVRDSAREFLHRHLPVTRLRQLLDTETGFDRDLWRSLADLTWTGMLVPPEYGGLGLSLVDLALVLEEFGRSLLPAPFVETAVALPAALAAAGSEAQKRRWLPGIASGEVVATLALAGADGLPPPAGIPVQAQRSDGGWILHGEVLLVPFGQVANLLLVPALTGARGDPDGVSLFLVEPGDVGASLQPLNSLDPTFRLSALRLDGLRLAADRLVGDPGQGWPALDHVLQASVTALALQAAGGAGQALGMAVQYAKERHQFGKSIGSFQAIKHKCAEMCVQYETARSAAYYAAWAVSAGAPDAPVAAAMAKAACTEMFRYVAGEAIQVHGGIGFTWEHNLHFYFKRAKYLEYALGTPSQHREGVAAACLGTAQESQGTKGGEVA